MENKTSIEQYAEKRKTNLIWRITILCFSLYPITILFCSVTVLALISVDAISFSLLPWSMAPLDGNAMVWQNTLLHLANVLVSVALLIFTGLFIDRSVRKKNNIPIEKDTGARHSWSDRCVQLFTGVSVLSTVFLFLVLYIAEFTPLFKGGFGTNYLTAMLIGVATGFCFLSMCLIMLFNKLTLKALPESHKLGLTVTTVMVILSGLVMAFPDKAPRLWGAITPSTADYSTDIAYYSTYGIIQNGCIDGGVTKYTSAFAYFPISSGECYYNAHYKEQTQERVNRRYLAGLDGDKYMSSFMMLSVRDSDIKDRLKVYLTSRVAAFHRFSQIPKDERSLHLRGFMLIDYQIDEHSTLESISEPLIKLIESESEYKRFETDDIQTLAEKYGWNVAYLFQNDPSTWDSHDAGKLLSLNRYSRTLNHLEEGPVKTYIMNMAGK